MTDTIRVVPLPHSTVFHVYSERDTIQLDPVYQRASDIWTKEKKQLLIDSILNEYDLPKLYFHELQPPLVMGQNTYSFAIVDGKQRLEAIWGFINGSFALDDKFEYLRDPSIDAGGLTYGELGRTYPRLKSLFDSSSLPIHVIETRNIELIEDMFSRLNEAVPLNAPEKRNAFGGPLPRIIRRVTEHTFFSEKLPIKNARYRYMDLAIKFLYICYVAGLPNPRTQIVDPKAAIADTKKMYLDQFVKDLKVDSRGSAKARAAEQEAIQILDTMASRFVQSDDLLARIGMVLLYFHVFRLAQLAGVAEKVQRVELKRFEELRLANRKAAEEDITQASYDLLEFDTHAQTPNDSYAMRIRLRIFADTVGLPLGIAEFNGSSVPRDGNDLSVQRRG